MLVHTYACAPYKHDRPRSKHDIQYARWGSVKEGTR